MVSIGAQTKPVPIGDGSISAAEFNTVEVAFNHADSPAKAPGRQGASVRREPGYKLDRINTETELRGCHRYLSTTGPKLEHVSILPRLTRNECCLGAVLIRDRCRVHTGQFVLALRERLRTPRTTRHGR